MASSSLMGQRFRSGCPISLAAGANVDSSKRMCLAKSLDFQIANLQNDGIVFDICNEESAKAYLSANTYLFRIKRYASNFNKHEDGKYKNLDFAVLKDLAVIDYELRMALEYLVANTEHGLKRLYVVGRAAVCEKRHIAMTGDCCWPITRCFEEQGS